MARTPLTRGPHAMRADRLAFATPVLVREAGREGWITLHSADSDEGTVHVYVGAGGYIEKGPKALTHQHIGAIASHHSVARTTRHPAGHEPQGAREHPDFHEAGPKPRSAQQTEGQEPAKSPGKPYARLHGAGQGTRTEQVGKALSDAQGAARGAKAARGWDKAAKPVQAATDAASKKGTFGERREATLKAMQDKEKGGLPRYRVLGASDEQTTCDICGKQDLKRTVALHHEVSGDVVRAGTDCAAELLRTSRASIERAAQQHGEKREVAIQKALESHPNQEIIKRFAGRIDAINRYHRGAKTTPSETEQQTIARSRQRIAELTAEARRDIEKQLPADKPLPQAGSAAPSRPAAAPFAAPQKSPEDKVADAAVAHQQAQAALAAHRAAHDRNPNPWAPHLSPPVGDAKDKELAEKATRAQLAHQAAQAQQQGAQQQQQTAEQGPQEQAARARRDEPIVMPDGSTRTRQQYDMAQAVGKEAADRQMRAAGRSTWNEEDYTVFARAMNEHLDRNLTLHRGAAAERAAQKQTEAQSKPAFAAPQAKEKPHVAPQPEQRLPTAEEEHAQAMRGLKSHYEQLLEDRRAAMSPKARRLYEQRKAQQQAPSAPTPLTPEHRESLQAGRRLLAQKALDPEGHKARVEAAVQKATATDPYEASVRGYARHGTEWAERLAHTEAANHYQKASQNLYGQMEHLSNRDKGGALAKAHQHIEVLTHHEQRAAGRSVPESDEQARELLARSQAIGRHYSAAAQQLAAKAAEHRAAVRGQQRVRESATAAPRFSAAIPSVREGGQPDAL